MAGKHTEDFDLLLPLWSEPRADDRMLAIVQVSYIERYAGETLAHHLPGANRKLSDKLLDPDGILGPFVARIDMARALDLINEIDHANLKTLASIRNQFAHHIDISSFDHPEIVSRTAKLKFAPHEYKGAAQEVLAKRREMFENFDGRSRFQLIAIPLSVRFHNRMQALTHPDTVHLPKY